MDRKGLFGALWVVIIIAVISLFFMGYIIVSDIIAAGDCKEKIGCEEFSCFAENSNFVSHRTEFAIKYQICLLEEMKKLECD